MLVALNFVCCRLLLLLLLLLLSVLSVSEVMFPFRYFLMVLMEVHSLFLFYCWYPFWQNVLLLVRILAECFTAGTHSGRMFFHCLVYLLLLWFEFIAYVVSTFVLF
jgi:hypothetical protein